jgi:hypothetical protein
VKAGTVVGKCMSRHRAMEFRKFLDEIERNVPTDLDIHVVMDNYGNVRCRSRAVSSLGMSSITSCPHASSSRHQRRSPALA